MSGTLNPVVLRLREIATTAAKTGQVSEAPAHPDAVLLDLCATALNLSAKAEAIQREALAMRCAFISNPAYKAEIDKRDAALAERRSPMARIGKIAAKTAAGVYAKALVLKDSHGTAPRLAMSLAEDLENCPGLRSILWPAEQEGQS